jgi:hypothetical protein
MAFDGQYLSFVTPKWHFHGYSVTDGAHLLRRVIDQSRLFIRAPINKSLAGESSRSIPRPSVPCRDESPPPARILHGSGGTRGV